MGYRGIFLALLAVSACGRDPSSSVTMFGATPATDGSWRVSAGASSGHRWSRVFKSPGSAPLHKVGVDGSGNTVVHGVFDRTADFGWGSKMSPQGRTEFVASYSPLGSPRWFHGFGRDDPNNERLFLHDMAVDANGFVAFTGYFDRAFAKELVVALIGPDGTELWRRRFSEEKTYVEGDALAFDAEGNVLLVGQLDGRVDLGGGPLESAKGGILLVAKFDPMGNYVWSRLLGGAKALAMPNYGATAVGADGSVVLLASVGSNFTDAEGMSIPGGANVVFKLDSQGNLLWIRPVLLPLEPPRDTPVILELAIDSTGAVVVVGRGYRPEPLPSSGPTRTNTLMLNKLDPAGKSIWSRSFEQSGVAGVQVGVRSGGGIVVSGSLTESLDLGLGPLVSDGHNSPFVAEFTPGGEPVSSVVFAAEEFGQAADITVDSQGDILCVGRFSGSIDFGGGPFMADGDLAGFLVKLTPPL